MINIFHGEDITASRGAFPEGAIKVGGKAATAELLVQLLSSNSLFEERKTVVLENPKSLTIDISDPTIDLILWFDHKLTTTQLKQYHGVKVQEFKLDQVVFKFVESLRPCNQREMLNLFTQYIQQELPEIILTMVIRQFRLMLNPAELVSWQKEKIISQSAKFTPERLGKIYQALLDMDYSQKSGQVPSDLKGSLELFLLTL